MNSSLQREKMELYASYSAVDAPLLCRVSNNPVCTNQHFFFTLVALKLGTDSVPIKNLSL